MSKKKKYPIIVNILKKIKLKQDRIVLKGLCLVKGTRIIDFNLENVLLKVHNKKYNVKFKFKKGIPFIRKYKINIYEIVIPTSDLINFDIQNKMILEYGHYKGRIIYNAFDMRKGKNKNSKIIFYENYSIYLRQTNKNTMYLTIREKNITDEKLYQIKLFLAFVISKIYHKKIILMYEKNSSRYEESASVLFEKLIDAGYKNVFYIINKDNDKLKNIETKYKKNMIYKNSFKHYLYFFMSKTFIGTETIWHAIQLRIANKYAFTKARSNKLNYIFLQHGVMYMISLDSAMRSGFRDNNYNLYKVVVSSELEKEHFIELGGLNEEELYVTGLAKFDKSIRYKNADKIVIMPTWRRWETNQARNNFEKTRYYKMIKKIVNAIPKEYDDKIIVLPHPLMIEMMKNSKSDLNKYLVENKTYDEILRECSLLITDYSSISYDAFYRGSNVIFYWEEKDKCLKKYGANTKLMLTEKLAFGDVCYNKQDLKNSIKREYLTKQEQKYKNRYRKIVQFNDNKNSERIIENLKKDKIIGD